MIGGRKLAAWVVGVLAGAGVLIGVALYWRGGFQGPVASLGIDLARPDVLIQSRQLSALPRELVALPGLRDVLTQDFVQYYEEHPDRLTLEGTLRRLAFEHGLTWRDRLVATLLDAPAQLALWSDGKGRLAYAALLLDENAAAQALEQIGKVALPDSQLTRAGSIAVGGKDSTVYALKLRADSTLLFVSSGKRLLVLTHPGMLLDANRALASGAAAAAGALLGSRPEDAWRHDFALAELPPQARHAITAKAAWLSFGYQHFFPAVQALRFELAGSRWSLSLAATPQAWKEWPAQATAAWSVLPGGAAFCAALPVSWDQAAAPLDAAALAHDLQAGAGACWYPGNGLYAPVLALRFQPGTGASHDEAVAGLLARMLAKPKDGAVDVAQKAVAGGGKLWTADVANERGYLGSGEQRAHRIAVLRLGDTVLASVDHRAIEQALAVAEHRYPALADDYPGSPLLVAGLPALGEMLQAESLRLTQDTPAFRQVVQRQLKPRLDALAAGGKLAFRPDPDNAGSSRGDWLWKPLVLGAARSN
ncbi:DUF2138 family protein [Ramlibacter sp. G-1-2-2]|uniref:DUF2138 family protein n=1 Tax=Ramlibacter agri TaxID=2728837 RepID=A0A848H3I0_9BURK|nr:DUF2138 family protein [Ramlibacter agri]NML43223.1 DUF2138 family protein [Ramlibacter agri]